MSDLFATADALNRQELADIERHEVANARADYILAHTTPALDCLRAALETTGDDTARAAICEAIRSLNAARAVLWGKSTADAERALVQSREWGTI